MDFKKIKIDKNTLYIILGVVGVLVIGALTAGAPNLNFNFAFGMSKDDIAQKAMDYINNKALQPGTTASLLNTTEESGLIKLRIKIGSNEFDSYVTKDAKLLFPSVMKLENGTTAAASENTENNEEPAEEEPVVKKTCETIKKEDKASLEAFVVSKCPFGLQMQRVLADIVKNVPSLDENIKVVYMGSVANGKLSAMHGEEEANENLRQICIREEQSSKYWDYISCHIKAGNVDSCLADTGVDKSKLSGCMSDVNRGIKFAKVDADLTTKYNVRGSPTLILNGENVSEFDFGGRTSEAVKNMLCCGFNSEVGVCSTKLNTSSAASSFSETYSKSGSAPANSDSGCDL